MAHSFSGASASLRGIRPSGSPTYYSEVVSAANECHRWPMAAEHRGVDSMFVDAEGPRAGTVRLHHPPETSFICVHNPSIGGPCCSAESISAAAIKALRFVGIAGGSNPDA
jgi:hypothetical protein